MRNTIHKLLLSVLMALTSLAHAAFPEKPIELVVPFPAGGGGDLSARIIATAPAERLGQPVRVKLD